MPGVNPLVPLENVSLIIGSQGRSPLQTRADMYVLGKNENFSHMIYVMGDLRIIYVIGKSDDHLCNGEMACLPKMFFSPFFSDKKWRIWRLYTFIHKKNALFF